MNGIVTVALEPGSPTAAHNAEDVLACALSLKPVFDAVGKTQKDALVAGAGIQMYGAPLAILVDPLASPAAEPVVAPAWMRIVVTTQSVGADGASYHTDIVPELNRTIAASSDGAAAFRAAMRSGVALCLRESVVGSSSAAKALAGASLQYLAPSADPKTLTGFGVDDLTKWQHLFDQYGSWHMLVPTDPAVGAAWIVEPETGTTVAVLLDGSGGGCGAAVANAAIQTALAFVQVAIAYLILQCENTEGGGFACDGALVFSVGALVLALFAGAAFHQDLAIDILFAALGLALFPAPPQIGLAVSILGVLLAAAESLESINQDCSEAPALGVMLDLDGRLQAPARNSAKNRRPPRGGDFAPRVPT